MRSILLFVLLAMFIGLLAVNGEDEGAPNSAEGPGADGPEDAGPPEDAGQPQDGLC
jgi:hypothetical protein